MPRPLPSLNQCDYVHAIEVDDIELDKVVALLGIIDPLQPERARHRIYGRIEDFKTARSRTARAKTISEDLQDLEHLAAMMEPTRAWAQPDRGLDALESLRTKNPVLQERLQQQLNPRRIPDLIRAVDHGTEPIEAIGQEVLGAIAALKGAIRDEDGRGAPVDHAARALASGLFQIWTEFTGRGTSRQSGLYRERDPFWDYVTAVGKLVEPDFKGRGVARAIRDASRSKRR